MREAVVDQSARPLRNLFRAAADYGVTGWTTGQSEALAITASTDAFTDKHGIRDGVRFTRTQADIAVSMRMGQLNERRMAVVPGRTVTLLFKHRASAGFAGKNVRLRITGDASTTDIVPSGVPSFNLYTTAHEYRATFTFPTDVAASTWSPQVALAVADGAVGDWIEFGDVMVVEGTYTGPYLDGDSFGWRWLGTPGASESVGYPYPAARIHNLVPNGRGYLGVTSGWGSAGAPGTRDVVTTGGHDGGPFIRQTFTGSGSNGLYYGATPSARPVAMPGQKFTALAWLRASKSVSMRIVCERKNLAGGSSGEAGNVTGSTVTLLANTWTKLRLTGIEAWDATEAWTIALYSPTTNAWAAGDTLDAELFFTDVADYQGEYCDGYTPGWSWMGTAGLSRSVGWPYTLTSILGRGPDVSMVGTGNGPTVTRPDSPLDGMALYSVYDVTSQEASFGTLAVLGSISASGGRLAMQSSSAGNENMSFRVDTLNGTVNASASRVSARKNGRHVLSLRAMQGMEQARGRWNGSTTVTSIPLTPANGIPEGRIAVSAMPGVQGVYAFGIYREIDDATDLAILRWLGNAYGVPVS